MKRILLVLVIVVFVSSMLFIGSSGKKKDAPAEEAAEKAEQVNIVIWWWGEQYQIGFQDYLEETAALFEEKYPNITVELTLLGTDVVLTQFPMAVAAG